MVFFIALACSGPPKAGAPGEESAAENDSARDSGGAVAVTRIDDVPYLTRLSLDLRGTRPTLDEIASVQADPLVIDDYISAWVAAPEFADRMMWIWNDAVHTAIWPDEYDRFDAPTFDEWKAMGAEPLQIIRAIIDEDRPITDVVTTQQTIANPTLAALYGLPYTGKDEEWSWTSYQDGRPMAGILSSASFWLRYSADATNFNRRRANAVAGILLCSDFFNREGAFEFGIDESNLQNIENAVATEPGCLSCHSSLDPMAAFFGGFAERSEDADTIQSYTRYSAHTADWYTGWTPPAYYGHPGQDIEDLGAMIAADPRFSRCAARRVYEGLVHAELPGNSVLPDAFVDDDQQRIRAFALRVVHSDAYRADDVRTLTTEQLYTTWSAMLGWDPGNSASEGLKPLMWSDDHRVLGGGTDDNTVLIRNTAPGVASQVLLEWTSRQAIPGALAADHARAAEDRRLLTHEDDVNAQLAAWYTLFLSTPVAVDSASVAGLRALYDDAGGGDAGWQEALSALIRHPRSVMY